VAENLMIALYVTGFVVTSVGTALYVRVLWQNDQATLRVASQVAWLSANTVFMLTGTKMVAIFCGYSGALNLLIIVVSLLRQRHIWVRNQDLPCIVAVAACLGGYFVYSEQLMFVTLLAVLANQVATWPTYQNAWAGGEKTIVMFMSVVASSGAAAVSEAILHGFSFIGMAGVLTAIAGNITLTCLTLYRRLATVGATRSIPEALPELAGASA